MTVSSTSTSATALGNGSSKTFNTGFMFMADADLAVTVAGVPKTLNVDYTVAGAGNSAGGSITFGAAPANGASVVITRSTAKTQSTDLSSTGPFDPDTYEAMVDRLTLISQEPVVAPTIHYFATDGLFGSGVTDISGLPKSCYWVDKDGLVHVELNAQHASASGWTVGTLPVGMRPPGTLQRPVATSGAPATLLMCQIASTGVITMTPYTASTSCLGSFTFRPDAQVA